MKVAILSGVSRGAGGLFYAVGSLCRELHAGGVDVAVLGAHDKLAEADRADWRPVPVETYRAFGPMKSSLRLRRLLALADAAVVHQHGLWMDDQWAALQWQRKTGRPVVISPHGMLDPWAVKNSAWKKRLVGALFANESLRRATCLHALCRAEAEAIRAYGLSNPIAVIPNGIALPDLAAGGREPKTPDRRQLLFLGRIHPKKGLKQLLEAWAAGSGAWRRDWRLVIAGWDDGGHEEELRALARRLAVEDSVEFAGPAFGAEKDRLLRGADAFVLPSFSEGLPMSVLEAWAYGLPVLMTGFCNLHEGFEAGAALRIEPDPGSVARGLSALSALADDARIAMGARGRKLVEEKFSWPGIAETMRSVYEWCLTGGNPPGCMEFSDRG